MTALEFFQRENIQWLPVDPMKVIRNEKIKALEYTEFSRIVQEPIPSIIREYGDDGFTTIVNGVYTIIYNKEHASARIRWTLMHEISHIMLGHLNERMEIAARGSHRDKYDLQADAFTANILAPLPVLCLCEADTAEKIKYISGLSNQASEIRLRELQQADIKISDLLKYKEQFCNYIEYNDYLADMAFDREIALSLKYYSRKRAEVHPYKRNRIPEIHPRKLMEMEKQ